MRRYQSLVYSNLLLLIFFALFFLTPYGLPFGGEIVWFTDFFSLAVLAMLTLLILSGQSSFLFSSYRINAAIILLVAFFCFEFILPLIGVVIWNDVSSASSSLRALLYWLPFLLLFFVFNPNNFVLLNRLDKLFFIAVLSNLIYGLVELAIYFELLPAAINFRLYFSDIAPQERFLRNRMMSFGFFQNSTAYGVFGFLAFIHCLSRALELDRSKLKYFLFALFSFLIIVLSTSRVPLAAASISFALYLMLVKKKPWNLFLSFLFSIFGLLIIVGLFSFDAVLFSRFTRLIEGGVEGDYSLNQRLLVHWPRALDFYFGLGHPTFTNPSKYIGTIDSGYLTYLVQGGWMMLALTIVFLLFMAIISFFRVFLSGNRNYFNYYLFFISVYIILGMLISNPMRSPIIIAFLCFAVFGFSSRRFFGAKV